VVDDKLYELFEFPVLRLDPPEIGRTFSEREVAARERFLAAYMMEKFSNTNLNPVMIKALIEGERRIGKELYEKTDDEYKENIERSREEENQSDEEYSPLDWEN
jgi:hypothetical protein